MKKQNLINIVVTGDITMDWNIARLDGGKGGDFQWNPDMNTVISWQRGGAALLADLITHLTIEMGWNNNQKYSIYQSGAPSTSIDPTDSNFNHSHSIWSQFSESGKMIWRVSEFLGLDRQAESNGPNSKQMSIVEEPDDVDILIIDDAALGFRDHPKLWPNAFSTNKNKPWIILKMSQPVAQGELWRHLLDHFLDRLIVLTTVSDLRRTEVQISKGLSWERTAQDVIWELEHNPHINSMSRCSGVVVSFGAAGAVIHHKITENQKSQSQVSKVSQLVFDPGVIEGGWIERHPGGMIGYTTCLAAGIAKILMVSREGVEFVDGVQSGLSAMRDLHSGGYEDIGETGKPRLQFPHQRIAHHLTDPTEQFAVVEIQDPVRFLFTEPNENEIAPESGYWSILEEQYRRDLGEICEQIVIQGAETSLMDVPQGIFGALFTVDRQEIESFRSIAALAQEYFSQVRPKRPLSIGVFGGPGSGKSFGITQVAKSLAPGRVEVLEFNLSQFESTEELIDAMHQIRDVNLSGKFPLVFWDEFDASYASKPLGWLRYFLAPMQDGEFREGQIVHPIGPAIFVFAGGTSERMASFGQGLDDETYKSAKVPDFVSRLKGFVNILGPNPSTNREDSAAQKDTLYKIRRAILLRSILWRNARHLFQRYGKHHFLKIDRGVLRAFLNTRFYKHGIRSMESIVAMSQLTNKAKYERSSLPPEAQLDLHVDGQEFLALVQQFDLTEQMLEKLASLFHENFCSMMKDHGYVYGEFTDDDAKTHSSLVEFSDLPADEQEQNRDTVRHIYNKLTASGYIMIPARSNELPFEFPGAFLEKLSMMEHERWMNLKFANGWQYAVETDKASKYHADLVPWDKLSESAKKKDREFVLAIPQILAKAGYTVVELRPLKA